VAIDYPERVGALALGCTTPQAARRGHRLASAQHDASAELSRIGAPTLVLHGTDDAFCPVGNAELLIKRIAGADLALFDGARHAYFLERREEASQRVVDFLAAHPLTHHDH
jgi:pimeloyl-ACP methyl ester carboxylesterase